MQVFAAHSCRLGGSNPYLTDQVDLCDEGIRRTDTANEELHLEQSCNASSTGQSSQHLSASVHSHG